MLSRHRSMPFTFPTPTPLRFPGKSMQTRRGVITFSVPCWCERCNLQTILSPTESVMIFLNWHSNCWFCSYLDAHNRQETFWIPFEDLRNLKANQCTSCFQLTFISANLFCTTNPYKYLLAQQEGSASLGALFQYNYLAEHTKSHRQLSNCITVWVFFENSFTCDSVKSKNTLFAVALSRNSKGEW